VDYRFSSFAHGFGEAEEQQPPDHKAEHREISWFEQDLHETAEDAAEKAGKHLSTQPLDPDRTAVVTFGERTKTLGARGHERLGECNTQDTRTHYRL